MLWWFVNDAIPIFMMRGIPEENIPYVWGARVFMLMMLGLLFFLIHLAWKRKEKNSLV